MASSSPVENSATRGRRATSSVAAPTVAAKPKACGVKRVPAGSTTSPLLQVQLFERGQGGVEKLSALRQSIVLRRDSLLAELAPMNAAWDTPGNRPLERLQEIWRLLSFYERWLAQIQERVVKLSF